VLFTRLSDGEVVSEVTVATGDRTTPGPAATEVAKQHDEGMQ
jgi:hypothetical protein